MKSVSQQSLNSFSQNQSNHLNNHLQNLNSKNQRLNSNKNELANNQVSSVKSSHNSNDEDIMNYETLINKLAKGSINDKSIAIKKLLFLYENSRSRIYLYERRIVQSLELSLLIEQKEVSLSGLTLLEKIMSNASTESQIGSIFKKRLLSKVVLNLGSSDINVRKISHKCIHQFVRKFKDYQAVVTLYLKTALRSQAQQQNTTKHLKLKAINSLHSLLMAENKCFRIDQDYSLQLIQELIASSYQKEYIEIRRAALICLICVLKIQGSENTLKQISMKAQNELYQLRMQNQQLAALLQIIMKHHLFMMKGNNTNQNSHNKDGEINENDSEQEEYISSQNAPSPKFISIQQSEVLIQKPPKTIDQLPKSIQHLAKCMEQKIPKSIEYNNNASRTMIEHSLPRSVEQIQDKSSALIIPMMEHHSMSDLQPQPHQLKIFNQVSYAEEFLKRLQKISFTQFTSESLEEIKSFAPFLEKYLVDESIKLFSISKKIVQVIFDSMQDNILLKEHMTESLTDKKINQRKQVYVVVVPCVVKGIGNKRFIVRKNLDKLVRTYAKNHPDVWINNFLDRFVKTPNPKIKQILMDLFSYAYKTSPEFYLPVDKPFEIFDAQISNKNSTLRWKAIDCVILLIQRQGKQSVVEEMLQKFSLDSYHKILRKLNKNLITTVSNQDKQIDINNQMIEIQVPTPVSNYKRKFKRNQRILTDQNEKLLSIQKSQNNTDRNLSQQRKINLNKGLFFKDKQNRKSFIDYEMKQRRKTQKRSKESKQRTSLQRLPELKLKTSVNSQSLSKNELPQTTLPESPVKKSFTEKNIMYTEKSQLQSFQDPKGQLERALMTIKSNTSSWMSHFDSINKIRAVIENHPQVISEEHLQSIVTDLINCLNGNSRSGVMKISLICIDELMLKLKKRLYPFTETIIQAILKKSISTSQFMVDELKKCITICTEQLCNNRIISFVNGLIRESKNTEIKLNVLLIIQTMIRQQKVYRKQSQWIWAMLIQLHDEPQFQLRQQCKNIVKSILQYYKPTWKQDVSGFKKSQLQKIDKIIKNIAQKGENIWLQQQSIEFEKILSSKGINSKYFTTEYSRFQETDRMLQIKKNWKERIRNINDMFSLAFQYSAQFEMNANSRKYMMVLCEHLDEKNPGQLLNGVGLMIKCMDVFVNSQLMEETLNPVLQRYFILLDSKRTELIGAYNKLIGKVYARFEVNRVVKQLVKLGLSPNVKVKIEAINQLISIVKENSQEKRQDDKQSLQRRYYEDSSQLGSNNAYNGEKMGTQQQQQRSRQKLKNKENTISNNKQLSIYTPSHSNNNNLSSSVSVINNNSNRMVQFNIGSQTPNSAASSTANISISNLNSENKHHSISHQKTHLNNNNNSYGSINSKSNINNNNFGNNGRVSTTTISMIMKMVTKLNNEKLYQGSTTINNRLKDLTFYCNKRITNSNINNNQNSGHYNNNESMYKNVNRNTNTGNNLYSSEKEASFIQ